MRGKIAREIRKLVNYPDRSEVRPPQLLVVDTRKGLNFIIDPNGPHEANGIRYNFKEVEVEITQLASDPVRQLYQDVKKQWYQFNRTEKQSQNKKEA